LFEVPPEVTGKGCLGQVFPQFDRLSGGIFGQESPNTPCPIRALVEQMESGEKHKSDKPTNQELMVVA